MPSTEQGYRHVPLQRKNHTEIALSRFAPGERVVDNVDNRGTVQALYGVGPVFGKMIVKFDCGVTIIVRDYEVHTAH